MRDQSPSTLTVRTPTSYSSEEGVAAGHSGQFTPWVYLSTLIHTTLVDLEPATFRSLVDCWSDALPVVPPTVYVYVYYNVICSKVEAKPVKSSASADMMKAWLTTSTLKRPAEMSPSAGLTCADKKLKTE